MAEFEDRHETSEDDNFREIIEREIGGSFPALMEFDEVRNALYDRLAVLAVEMSESRDRHGNAEIDFSDIGASFKKLIANIHEAGSDLESTRELIIDFIKNDSDERVHMMRGFLEGDECIEQFERAQIVSLLDDIVASSDTTEEMIDGAVALYEYDLQSDIRIFVDHLIDLHLQRLKAEPDHNETKIEIKKSVSEHVVDVAKIAAGVSIALAVDRLIRKFK